MPDPALLLDQADLLVSRLERLSADSLWAHRASGARGALLKALEQIDQGEAGGADPAYADLQGILDWGFRLLENAAKEMLR